ncbi:MAG: T9SS type A sorting domain-containing protein, partial [Ignavibacteria bacterium]
GSEIPKNYSLHQNYPNPFNPSTKIRFELPVSEVVTLKLYDVNGKEISTLINEKLTAGIKEYEYNAVNLPSGVYFYTITAGDFKDTKKMVLVK